MQQVDFGVETDGVIVAQLLLPRNGYSEAEERIAFHDRLLEELRGIPGLTASALVSNAPGIGAIAMTRVLAGVMFGVGTSDPATLASVALILSVVTASACFFPARRAPRPDVRDPFRVRGGHRPPVSVWPGIPRKTPGAFQRLRDNDPAGRSHRAATRSRRYPGSF